MKMLYYTEPKKRTGFIFLPGRPVDFKNTPNRVCGPLPDEKASSLRDELSGKGCINIRIVEAA